MAYLDKNQISAIYFGIFNSNSWSTSTAFKLTHDFLYADKSESYWSSRFTKDGYIFSGDKVEIGKEKLVEITSLLAKVPIDIFQLELPKNSDPGNKDEYIIFMQVDRKDGKTLQFKIDEYSDRDLTVDKSIIQFKDNIKAAVKEIQS